MSPQTQSCGDVLSGTQEHISSLHYEYISFLFTVKAGFGGHEEVTLGFQGTLLECKPLKKTLRSQEDYGRKLNGELSRTF